MRTWKPLSCILVARNPKPGSNDKLKLAATFVKVMFVLFAVELLRMTIAPASALPTHGLLLLFPIIDELIRVTFTCDH